jgi:hypothetical protein
MQMSSISFSHMSSISFSHISSILLTCWPCRLACTACSKRNRVFWWEKPFLATLWKVSLRGRNYCSRGSWVIAGPLAAMPKILDGGENERRFFASLFENAMVGLNNGYSLFQLVSFSMASHFSHKSQVVERSSPCSQFTTSHLHSQSHWLWTKD